MNFKQSDIIFLLGAGASADAEIPTSRQMVLDVEMLLDNGEFSEFYDLYNFLKSSINYAEGIIGNFDLVINIERLVNTLSELEKKELHVLYPFVGNWNTRLLEICGSGFEGVKEFKEKILHKIYAWLEFQDIRKSAYLKKLYTFQQEYNNALRVFTLNYDLCLERNCPPELMIERGFDESNRIWSSDKFDISRNEDVSLFLYKMHGSIDWQRESNGNLTFNDRRPERPDLIFGTNYKLQYIDPYLFYAHELRKWSLEARLIVCVGYSFGDEHVNSIIGQAFKGNSMKRLLCIDPLNDDSHSIEYKLGFQRDTLVDQIITRKMNANDFFNSVISIAFVESIMPTISATPVPF